MNSDTRGAAARSAVRWQLVVSVTWQADRGGCVQTTDNQPCSAAPHSCKTRPRQDRLRSIVGAARASASRNGKGAAVAQHPRHRHQGSRERHWVMGSSSTGVKAPFLACARRSRRITSAGPSCTAGLTGEVTQSRPPCCIGAGFRICTHPLLRGAGRERQSRHLTWLQRPMCAGLRVALRSQVPQASSSTEDLPSHISAPHEHKVSSRYPGSDSLTRNRYPCSLKGDGIAD